LSNWSAETFPLVRDDPAYAFLDRFRTIFVSGELRLVKPDPAIYRHVLAAIGAAAEDCLFVDDSPANVAAAAALGIASHRFTEAAGLRATLADLALLPRT
jgi:FMN phosphatase YigB (HAD superfamily)